MSDHSNGNGSAPLSSESMEMDGIRLAQLAEIRALSTAVLDRMQFLRQAGLTFGGLRDTYEILGYDRIITTKQYRDRYARGGIAARIVEALPKATWRGGWELIEDNDPKVTTHFEEIWNTLETRLKISATLQRVDILAGLSTYAILLIGAPGRLDTELPRGTPEKLLYLTPFCGGGGPNSNNRNSTNSWDADATIASFDDNINSPRFGLPVTYQIKRTDLLAPELLTPVHWTRVIHIAEGCLDDEVYGQPSLERVWNLLDDLDKVTGGGAEAFWLRANQGLHINIHKDLKMAPGEKEHLQQQADEYQHQIRRMMRTRGVEIEALGSDVANFNSPADAILTQIAGAKSVPKRILTGSEMGELASSQDRDNWKDQVNGRQTGYADPYIVRPLVDRLIKYGYLPTPKSYEVRWPHVQILTEQEKSAGAASWASTNSTQGRPVFTTDEIRDHWYGLPPLTEDQLSKEAPAPPPPLPGPVPEEEVSASPAKILPFPRAAMEGIHPDWHITKSGLVREFKFEDRRQCASFLAALFNDANTANHHPDVATGTDSCTVTFVTHSEGDTVTDLDYQSASRADTFAQTYKALEHKFASTQINLPKELADELLAFASRIPDEDLAEDGREKIPHVTVKYGIHSNSPEEVQALLKDVGPIRFSLGRTEVFRTTPDYDVLYVNVSSDELQSLNARLSGHLEVTNTHPVYQPHVTLAYLKLGAASQYVGDEHFLGRNIVADEIIFTSADDKITKIALKSDDHELLQILQSAIEAGNLEVIDRILGIRHLGGDGSGNFGHSGGEGGPGNPGGSGGGGGDADDQAKISKGATSQIKKARTEGRTQKTFNGDLVRSDNKWKSDYEAHFDDVAKKLEAEGFTATVKKSGSQRERIYSHPEKGVFTLQEVVLGVIPSELQRGTKGKILVRLNHDDILRASGGPGSGNFGHEGRPGEVGGSGGGGSSWKSEGGFEHTGVTWKQPTDPKTGRPIPIKVSSVAEAAALVLEGKVVEVPDVKTAHTLIEKLAQQANEAKAAGQEAKDYDLCQVSVAGSNMFCAESLRTDEYPDGVPRLEMPQLGGKPVPGSEADTLPRNPWDKSEVDGAEKFISHLQGIGIRTSREVMPAVSLKASQRELVGSKVGKMMNDTSFDPAKNPIFISNDNYVVDGHHRWAAVVGRDAADGVLGDSKMNVVRVNAPISEVLHLANAWSAKFGIQQAAGVRRQGAKTGLQK